MTPFTDADLKRLKKIQNELGLKGCISIHSKHFVSLLARLETAEAHIIGQSDRTLKIWRKAAGKL